MSSSEPKPATSATCAVAFRHSEAEGHLYFLFFNRERRWLHVSDGICELLQYKREELLGITVDQLFPRDLEWTPAFFRKLLEKGRSTGVYVLQRKDGAVLGVRGEAQVLDDGCLLAIWEPIKIAGESVIE